MSTSGFGDLAGGMRRAASRFLGSLDDPGRRAASGPFVQPELTTWTYLPGPRPGVRIGNLSGEQRGHASQLLETAYSGEGAATAGQVIELEAFARDWPAGQGSSLLQRHQGQDYWLRILGSPTDAAWAWRLSGHHLVASAVVIEEVVSLTPQFFGANPTSVPIGVRPLAPEEDLARQLVGLLDEEQRRHAIFSALAPAEIQSRDDPIAVLPSGLAGLDRSGMDREQQQVFDHLLGHYLDRAPTAVSDQAWADLRHDGLTEVRFSWAGGLRPGEGHYYAIWAPTLLVEYDNIQNDADHIHSVWRDLRRDWGGDLLARHYREHEHAS